MTTCYVQGIDHVQFYVGNAMQSAAFYCHNFGFQPRAFRGLQTGDRKRCTHVISQNKVTFAFTSSLVNNDDEFHQELRQHGDTVKDVAFLVSNVSDAFNQALHHGAVCIQEPTKLYFAKDYVELAVVKPPFGNWIHTLINRDNQDTDTFLPGYRASTTNSNGSRTDAVLDFVDHIAFAIEKNTVHDVVRWYSSCFGFERFLSHDDDDSDRGLQINSDMSSGLTTMTIAPPAASSSSSVLLHDFKFVLVEPVNQNNTKSQIQEFLDFHGGPGVAHIALNTNDIITAVSQANREGVDFISVPDTYYSMWKEKRSEQYSLVNEDWERIRSNAILVDGQFKDEFRYLLQTFTLPLQDRPTFYLEVISRRGNNGFGKGNIKSLFDAIERLQKERGNYEVE
jgi:4-hydroxyphenylpyruvate dioxygenase